MMLCISSRPLTIQKLSECCQKPLEHNPCFAGLAAILRPPPLPLAQRRDFHTLDVIQRASYYQGDTRGW